MTDELIDPNQTETPAEPPAEAPAAPAQPDAATLERQIAELREQVAESNRTAQFWAEQARNGHNGAPAPAAPQPEPEDDTTDVLEAITTGGTKGFEDLAAKRGFVRRSEVEQMIESRASSIAKEQDLKERYPDLSNPKSEFFSKTAGYYGQLIKGGVNAVAAMEIAAEKAELEYMRAGKTAPGVDRGGRDPDRQARINAQSGGAGARRPAGGEADDDTLTTEQKHIADMMGISHEAYLKRAKAGVRMGGRQR